MKGMLAALWKKHFKLLISVAIIAALGFGMTAGLSCGNDSLKRSLDNYLSDYNYPDAVITTEVTTIDTADRLRAIEGVDSCYPRLYAETIMRDSEGKNFTVRAFTYTEEELQGFVYWSQADVGEEAVLVEDKFAESNNINAGDELSFRIDGEYRSYPVAGVISRPETIYAKINDDSWGLNYDFGYVYIPLAMVKKEYEKVYSEKKTELDEKSGEFDTETASAKELLDEKLGELNDATNLLDEQKQAFDSAKLEADAMQKTLTDKRDDLTVSLRTLNAKKAQLNTAISTLTEKEAELLSQYSSLKEAKEGLQTIDESLADLYRMKNNLNDDNVLSTIDELSALIPTLNLPVVSANVSALRARVIAARESGDINEIASSSAELASYMANLEVQVNADYAYLSSTQVASKVVMISSSGELPTDDAEYNEIAAALARYNDEPITSPTQLASVYYSTLRSLATLKEAMGRSDLQAISASLNSIPSDQYASDLSTILQALDMQAQSGDSSDDTLSGLYRGTLNTINSAISELESRRAQIVSELNANGVKESQIDDTLIQIRNGVAQCRTQRTKAQNGIAEIDSGITQINDGIAEIDDTLEEIRSQLSENSTKLDDAEKEIASNETELNRRTAIALKERTEIEQELKDAYALLDENEGYDHLCNEFLLYFDEDADPDKTLADAVAALDDLKVKKSYTYADSAVKLRIDENLDPLYTMMYILPSFFYVVILIVVFLFMSMIIKQSRREIGILRALGFTRGQVRLLFCRISLVVSFGGILLGVLVGAGLELYIGGFFSDFFSLPDFRFGVSPIGLFFATFLTVAVTQLATLISTGSIARIMPDEAMSRQVRSSAKIPAFLRLLINRLSPMTKFSAISLMRNKGRFVISTLCIAASSMLIFVSVSFIASKNHTMHQVFDERIHYDCQIFTEEIPSDEMISMLNGLDYIESLEVFSYYETDVSANGKSKSVVINAIDENSPHIGITDGAGRELDLVPGGIILERNTVNTLGVGIGDEVTVNGKTLTVCAISDQATNRIQYMTYADTEGMISPDLGCIVCNYSGDRKQELLTLLLDTDEYLYAVFTASIFKDNSELFAAYDLAAWILIGFAIVIGFVIVLNTLITNLHENKKELAILRTLGFQQSEISFSRFKQAAAQFVLSCIISFPLSAVVTKYALSLLTTVLNEFVYSSGLWEFALTGGLVFIYLVISHIAAMRSMKKWDITEIVKDKE